MTTIAPKPHPALRPLLEQFAALAQSDWTSMSAQTARDFMDLALPAPGLPELSEIRDIALPLTGRTLPARLYRPSMEAGLPLVVYFHGGGWVIGTLDTHDPLCRHLAAHGQVNVISVGYRLAPEFPYPAPLDDAEDALRYITAHAADFAADATRIAVAGDSAGGNLAAAVSLRARDRGGLAIAHQFLLYPVTDDDLTRASYGEFGDGSLLLAHAQMAWFWQQYTGGATHVPYASVLRADDLSGLPPATLITAALDILRDEGRAYAARLAQAGVNVELIEAPEMVHGFFSLAPMLPPLWPWLHRLGALIGAKLRG